TGHRGSGACVHQALRHGPEPLAAPPRGPPPRLEGRLHGRSRALARPVRRSGRRGAGAPLDRARFVLRGGAPRGPTRRRAGGVDVRAAAAGRWLRPGDRRLRAGDRGAVLAARPTPRRGGLRIDRLSFRGARRADVGDDRGPRAGRLSGLRPHLVRGSTRPRHLGGRPGGRAGAGVDRPLARRRRAARAVATHAEGVSGTAWLMPLPQPAPAEPIPVTFLPSSSTSTTSWVRASRTVTLPRPACAPGISCPSCPAIPAM